MIGRRPSAKTSQVIRRAVGASIDKKDDAERAVQIWKDFKWKLSILDRQSNTEKHVILIREFCERAKNELKSEEIRQAVLDRFTEMGVRLTAPEQ